MKKITEILSLRAECGRSYQRIGGDSDTEHQQDRGASASRYRTELTRIG